MNKTFTRTAITLSLLAANQAFAGGLWLNEYGDYSGGRASAGTAAGTGDAAGIIYNPAAARSVKSGELFMSAGYLSPTAEFDVESSSTLIGDGDGGSAGSGAPGGAFAYVNDFGMENWDFGASLGGLSGAGLDYDNDWVGRYQATEVNIILLAVSTSIAWHATDKLTLGIAPQYYYSELDLDVNLPNQQEPFIGEDARLELDGDDSGFGVRAGAIYELTGQTRIGIAYQSELEVKYSGDFKLKSGSADLGKVSESDTELTFAQLVRVSLHHDFNDRLGLDFSVGWDDWSALDQVLINVDATGGGQGLQKNWSDTYHYAAGFQYRINDSWEMTMGASYDTNPVDKEDRTADLPVDRQVRFAVGSRYHHSDSMVLGGYINYADLGDAEIEAQGFSGDYEENTLLSVSVFMNWQL